MCFLLQLFSPQLFQEQHQSSIRISQPLQVPQINFPMPKYYQKKITDNQFQLHCNKLISICAFSYNFSHHSYSRSNANQALAPRNQCRCHSSTSRLANHYRKKKTHQYYTELLNYLIRYQRTKLIGTKWKKCPR